MRSFSAIAVAGIVAVSSSACAAAGGGARGLEPAGPTAAVLVENSNWADMTVYVERAGARTRLGTVTAATSRLFRLPRSFAGIATTLRLVADPLGGSEAHTTASVQVAPGQQVNFAIQNHLRISSIWVTDR